MRYLKTTNTYKASNFSMNMNTLEAYSYGWWLFVKKDENGRVIVNKASYSNSTSKHQSKALGLLNYRYDLKLLFTRKSLADLETALQDEVRLANIEINNTILLTQKKGTKRATNVKRMERVAELNKHIENIVKNYL